MLDCYYFLLHSSQSWGFYFYPDLWLRCFSHLAFSHIEVIVYAHWKCCWDNAVMMMLRPRLARVFYVTPDSRKGREANTKWFLWCVRYVSKTLCMCCSAHIINSVVCFPEPIILQYPSILCRTTLEFGLINHPSPRRILHRTYLPCFQSLPSWDHFSSTSQRLCSFLFSFFL